MTILYDTIFSTYSGKWLIKKCEVICEECGQHRIIRLNDAKKQLEKIGKNFCMKCVNAGNRNPMFGMSGEKSPNYGKHPSDETLKKMSVSMIGKKHTDETKKLLSEINMGKKASLETKQKLSNAKRGRKLSVEHAKNISLGNKGKPKSFEHKLKLKEAAKKRFATSSHPNTILPENRKKTLYEQIRVCKKYTDWRTDVFLRDKRACTMCFSVEEIQADHIKPFALIIKENNIKTREEAEICNELWDINNGRTLCLKCHKDTDTYGSKTKVLLKESNKNE